MQLLTIIFKSTPPVLVAFLAIYSTAIAAFPSHCAPDQYAIVDSWMGEIYATGRGWRNKMDGKFLSLCADRKTEPFTKVIYRYGVLGQVEFEVITTPRAKFKIASLELAPKVGADVVFFKKNGFTYYISLATGQGQGVGLDVFKGSKRIARHFSGNYEGSDFQLGPAVINFMSNQSQSPVFILAQTKDVPHEKLLR